VKEIVIGMSSNQATALVVNNRYFSNFGPSGRLQTAWSLAGATLFGREDKIVAVEKRLNQKGYTAERVNVCA
jgi:hypothetical protein